MVSNLLFAGEKIENYDFDIIIDKNDSNKQDSFNIPNLVKLQVKIINLTILSDSEIEFDLNEQSGISIISQSNSTQNSYENGKEFFEKSITLKVKCLIEGKHKMSFANNIFDKSFIISLDIANVDLDEIRKEIGLERFIKKEKSKSKLISAFGEPNYRSSIFKDEIQLIEYFFNEYNIGYEILIKNDKVFDYKRYPE